MFWLWHYITPHRCPLRPHVTLLYSTCLHRELHIILGQSHGKGAPPCWGRARSAVLLHRRPSPSSSHPELHDRLHTHMATRQLILAAHALTMAGTPAASQPHSIAPDRAEKSRGRTAHCASTDGVTEGCMVDGPPAELDGILNLHVPSQAALTCSLSTCIPAHAGVVPV